MAKSFHYTRSILIAAPAEAIAPLIYDLRAHASWSPFAAPDPKRTDRFQGQPGVGQRLDFSGGKGGGGNITVDSVSPQQILMTLVMLRPMKAVNTVEYTLVPEAGGTRVAWNMYGPMTLLGRIMNLFMDCDAFCGGMFEQGLAALKARVEAAPQRSAA